MAFAFQIPYLYESEIKVYGNNKYDGKYNETAHPDFSFIINGKRKERYYRENGYRRGKNLICVECKDKQNMDSQKIAKVLIDLSNGIIPRETIYV